jgi:hypothetical protein
MNQQDAGVQGRYRDVALTHDDNDSMARAGEKHQ